MAPMAPLGRERAIELVRQGRHDLAFGSPHPCTAVCVQDGRYRIRELVIDEAEARRESEAALRRNESWMPEHHYALGRPTGEIYADAATPEELVELMKKMRWPAHW